MIEHCETCRFWARGYPRTPEVRDDVEWHVCDRAYLGRDYEVVGRMYVSAADDYDLALTTAPDFGCTEWQPVGDGIPVRIFRHGILQADGQVTQRGETEPSRIDRWPDPNYPADHTAVVRQKVEVLHGHEVWVTVEAFGEELFELAWVEVLEEAHRERQRLATSST
jgi:hypothetical protein